MTGKISQLALVIILLSWSLVMANGLNDERRVTSGVTRVGTDGDRGRMADRRFASQIRDIAQDRGLTGTRRRAAVALAGAERRAPRSQTAVSRPITTDSMRLLQEAVNNPRLRGGARKALIAGAAELGGRSDIAEDLTLGRGLRSVRIRPSQAQAISGDSGEADQFAEAADRLRYLQQRGLRQPLTQGLSRFNESNPLESGEGTFQDDLFNLESGQL